MQATRIELLQRMPIFGAIREDVLLKLLQRTQCVTRSEGEYFFRENDPADAMYVLEHGRATVLRQWEGRDYTLHQLVEGDCFGEMALMDLFPRSAAVRADTPCQALAFAATDLLPLFDSDPEQFALIQMNIGREVCRRLRSTDDLLFRTLRGAAAGDAAGAFRGT